MNLGELQRWKPMRATRRSRRSAGWVSKTDLMRCVRCPYSFWLLDTGKITFDDTIDEFQAGLLRKGVEFQANVESAAHPVEIDARELPAMLETDATVLAVPTFENRKLRIYGQPDGIQAEGGALLPIEVKAHKGVQATDELELAFYWMVLEPHRMRHDIDPRGVLMLRRGAMHSEIVEVPIKPHRFDEVERLLKEVRHARRYGVEPRICACIVCRELRGDEVLAATMQRKDLTLIFGIGRKYARALEDIGITTYDELLASDPQSIVSAMRDRRYYVSAVEIDRWKQHAHVWATGQPACFSSDSSVGDTFIALDLEYDPLGERIWLIGLCIVRGEEREHILLWADDDATERTNLRQLGKIVADHLGMPVVTWAGNSADTPQLKAAADRLNLTALEPLFERHFDLFVYARDSVRLPIPGLDLKGVAKYFGLARTSAIRDGMGAQSAYMRYRTAASGTTKRKLHDMLVAYCQDDVDGLIGVAQRISTLVVGHPSSSQHG
jgi:predicted RecB family nuclease